MDFSRERFKILLYELLICWLAGTYRMRQVSLSTQNY